MEASLKLNFGKILIRLIYKGIKMSIKVSVQGKDSIGCLREGKPIMLSLDGKDSDGVFKYLNAFLTKEEVEELIVELRNIMLENEKEN